MVVNGQQDLVQGQKMASKNLVFLKVFKNVKSHTCPNFRFIGFYSASAYLAMQNTVLAMIDSVCLTDSPSNSQYAVFPADGRFVLQAPIVFWCHRSSDQPSVAVLFQLLARRPRTPCQIEYRK